MHICNVFWIILFYILSKKISTNTLFLINQTISQIITQFFSLAKLILGIVTIKERSELFCVPWNFMKSFLNYKKYVIAPTQPHVISKDVNSNLLTMVVEKFKIQILNRSIIKMYNISIQQRHPSYLLKGVFANFQTYNLHNLHRKK